MGTAKNFAETPLYPILDHRSSDLSADRQSQTAVVKSVLKEIDVEQPVPEPFPPGIYFQVLFPLENTHRLGENQISPIHLLSVLSCPLPFSGPVWRGRPSSAYGP